MLRLPQSLLVCLAVVVLLPGAAYADDGPEAHDLQEQADGLIEQEYGLLPELSQLEAQVGQIAPGSGNRVDALPLLTKMAALLDKLTADARSIVALYHKAAALDVSLELKVYLTKQEELWRLHLKEQALISDKNAKLKTLFAEWESLSDAKRTELTRYVDAIVAQEAPLIAVIHEKERDSQQYFDDNRLGRLQVDWESVIGDAIVAFWQPLLFLLFMAGLLTVSLIVWIMRRLDQGVTEVGKGFGRLFKARPSGLGFQVRGNPFIWAALVLLVIGVSMIMVGVFASD